MPLDLLMPLELTTDVVIVALSTPNLGCWSWGHSRQTCEWVYQGWGLEDRCQWGRGTSLLGGSLPSLSCSPPQMHDVRRTCNQDGELCTCPWTKAFALHRNPPSDQTTWSRPWVRIETKSGHTWKQSDGKGRKSDIHMTHEVRSKSICTHMLLGATERKRETSENACLSSGSGCCKYRVEGTWANAHLLTHDFSWETLVLLERLLCLRHLGIILRTLDDGCWLGVETHVLRRSDIPAKLRLCQWTQDTDPVLRVLQRQWGLNNSPRAWLVGACDLRAGMKGIGLSGECHVYITENAHVMVCRDTLSTHTR